MKLSYCCAFKKISCKAKHINNCSESSLFIFILVIFFIFVCVCQLVMSTIYTLAVFCVAIKMIQLCSDLYREYKYMNICQTRWKLWLVIIIIMEFNPLISQKESKSNFNKDSKILYWRRKVGFESTAKEISFEWYHHRIQSTRLES